MSDAPKTAAFFIGVGVGAVTAAATAIAIASSSKKSKPEVKNPTVIAYTPKPEQVAPYRTIYLVYKVDVRKPNLYKDPYSYLIPIVTNGVSVSDNPPTTRFNGMTFDKLSNDYSIIETPQEAIDAAISAWMKVNDISGDYKIAAFFDRKSWAKWYRSGVISRSAPKNVYFYDRNTDTVRHESCVQMDELSNFNVKAVRGDDIEAYAVKNTDYVVFTDQYFMERYATYLEAIDTMPSYVKYTPTINNGPNQKVQTGAFVH